ncbi:MAG: potassium channel family protein [Methanobacterium sp.]
MKILILGCGKLGVNLASSLIKEKHDVTLIETNIDKCKIAANGLNTVVIHGNGTYSEVLEDAEVEDSDVFIAATGNDNTNLMASCLARDYKVPKIISRLIDPHHKSVFEEAGINNLIIPEIIVANHIKKLISN